MEIRAQIMRDWHQSISNNPAARGADGSRASGSATTSSTYKFKLGRRSLLPRPPTASRPRIRLKDGPSVEFEQERDLSLRRHENTVVDAATTPQNGQVMQTTATAGYQVPPAETLQSRQAERAQQQWLFNLEYFLQTDTLHNVPSGVLDPFNAMLLLITPRTQQLLHYYC